MRTITDDNWNLLGNPYPSAISVTEFLNVNTDLEGFVNLWTHGNAPSIAVADPFYDNFAANYDNDYITINSGGATSGPSTLALIGGGQGFMARMNPGTAATSTATFNNAMRNKAFSNSQFYRTANTKENMVQNNAVPNRIWLDLQAPSNQTTRTLLAYIDDATNGKDRMYDALTDVKNTQNLYTLIGEEIFTIQGRASFYEEDKVPVGFKTSTQGTHTIAIAFVDGLFENGQNIYLEDKELNSIHDLRQNPYSFYTTAGTFNERFVLRYTDEVLSSTDIEAINNSVTIISNENVRITSTNQSIKEIQIHNILGQILYQKTVNNNDTTINTLQKNNNVLLVKIILENNTEVVKKIIF
uniref:hypothetical protein n=1 Tax=Flavobacterium sp. TaxID=239 RepID=UPI00404A9594